VNLESDIIGKYVERLLPGRAEGGVSLDLLKKNGFAIEERGRGPEPVTWTGDVCFP